MEGLIGSLNGFCTFGEDACNTLEPSPFFFAPGILNRKLKQLWPFGVWGILTEAFCNAIFTTGEI